MSTMSNKRIRISNATARNKNSPISIASSTGKEDTVQFDLQPMSEEEVKLLKKKDPFLYYSIPELCEAEINLAEEVKALPVERTISRKTRVSFERHPSLLIDELFINEVSTE